jgi:ribokinase
VGDVVVVGQIARDLVLVVDEVPGPGGTAPVRERREALGGKGANIAVGLAQLGAPVALVGVVGDDEVGTRLLARAGADGIATGGVVVRPGCRTGLIVDVVADGALERLRDELLACADVVRADHHEAELLTGRRITTADDALKAARELKGLELVAFAVNDVGNVFRWDSGELVVPLGDAEVVDTTGGGDAFVAALTFALTRGDGPEAAARLAVEASGATVNHPGGRPNLTGR